ncbi:RimK family alpha-L-glutamate ligase [Lewinella sp. IMCC34183]|uniref:ATP-grasp domain-containing protein n=1 Tax=Lewinella sp. IMCC34183 TaxID=2248762 RepID=UPI000E2546C7|nr:glutathione synthetase [Lewinella sp. IMCC34183]
MKHLSFLVLTDHSGHSDQNSLYSLVNTLRLDPRCAHVDVASRGDAQNAEFFAGGGAQVRGFRVTGPLSYRSDGGAFRTADRQLDPKDYDVVWLRLPHPIAPAFFTWLEQVAAPAAGGSGPLVVNRPRGTLTTGDKSFLLNFPDLTPPVRLVTDEAEAREFAGEFPIVLKPLRAYGGHGIVRMDHPDASVQADWSAPYLAMKFLRNVSQGDKRILIVNGRILAASLRIPPPGEWLCNVAQGGRSVAADVEPEEEAMIAELAPVLLHHGICFAGVDTLVNDDGRRVLSEINTLSIGGFPQAQVQSGRPILQQAIDELFSYCYERC